MRPTRRLIYLELEKHGTRSIAQLAEAIGVDRKNISTQLNLMHDSRMAYIKDYDKPPRGGYVPLWALGDKKHRPSPRPLAPGDALASNNASKCAYKAEALRKKAQALRDKADELERRAQDFIEENQRIKTLIRARVKQQAEPSQIPPPKASPWAQLIR